jgi:flavodoxin I
MPKVVIVYDSKTGNTELMANAVAEGANSVKGVKTELRNIGAKFPISTLKDADAVVIGSPTLYGNITHEVQEFLANLGYLQQSKRIILKGKKGAAFGSYGWDGGWNTERIEDMLKKLGVQLVAPSVSAADQGNVMQMKIHKDDLAKCRELGSAVAKAVAGK